MNRVYARNMGGRFYQPPIMVDYRYYSIVNYIFIFGGFIMETNIALEIFGYIGTVLVIVSMMMTSVLKLRIINVCGGIISMIYSIFYNAWPVVIMNACLIVINVFQTIRQLRRKTEFSCVKVGCDDKSLEFMLSIYRDDIAKYFAKLDISKITGEVYMIYSGSKCAGVLAGSREDNVFRVDIDYTTPEYRDFKVGRFIFPELKEEGIALVVGNAGNTEHEKYLEKMGFVKENNEMVKKL